MGAILSAFFVKDSIWRAQLFICLMSCIPSLFVKLSNSFNADSHISSNSCSLIFSNAKLSWITPGHFKISFIPNFLKFSDDNNISSCKAISSSTFCLFIFKLCLPLFKGCKLSRTSIFPLKAYLETISLILYSVFLNCSGSLIVISRNLLLLDRISATMSPNSVEQEISPKPVMLLAVIHYKLVKHYE